MPKHPQRFWLAALIVAWAVDFLFWGKSIGISYPIFIALALSAGFILAYIEKTRPARLSLVLSGLVVLMALATILRAEPFTRVFNGMLALGSLGLLALTFRSGDWIRFGIVDYILSAFELLFAALSRAAGLPLIPRQPVGSAGGQVWKRSTPVLRGLLLAAPVVLIMGSLLASADMVFADQLKQFFSLFKLDRLPEYLFRLFYILMLAYAFAGVYLTAVLPKLVLLRPKTNRPDAGASAADAVTQGEDAAVPNPAAKRMDPRFLGSTESFIVLGSVDLLFAFFVAIQFRYFFGGNANIHFDGFTFSEYARRGFFELVAVAVLSLLLYLVLSAITRRENPVQERTFTWLAVLLVVLVGVILVSAWYRLMLYENAYGFTSLRVYTHIFIPWLGFLLLATVVLQIVHRQQYFGGLLLLTAFGFALTFPIVNVDAFIVHKNVERAVFHHELDGQYLISLSDDALPALVEEYNRTGLTKQTHDLVGGVIACWIYDKKEDKSGTAWQSYLPARALAWQKAASLDLTSYPIQVNRTNTYVRLIASEVLYCTAVQNGD